MEQEILLEDNSGDKKYFTIIPNYIANHSTAIDQALYFQLKRLAGDTEKTCYPSHRYLLKHLGIGIKTLKKSFQYLIDNEWIIDLGKKRITTAGGLQWINAYRINDIWRKNIEYYEENKGADERTPLKTKVQTRERKVQTRERKVQTVVSCKEELNKNNKNIVAKQSFAGSETQPLIELFKSVNPSYNRLFSNKTQRSALERMVKIHGKKRIEWTINILEKTNGMKYAPTITTPITLENKLGDLIAFLKKEKGEPISVKL